MQSNQVDPSYYQPYSNLGLVDLLKAQWAIKQGQSPLAHFDASRSNYQKSIQSNKGESDTYRAMAEIYRQQAEWEIQEKRSAKKSIAKGLEWINKSLTIDKDVPDALVVQGGRLFLLQAREEKNSKQHEHYAAAAATALDKAIKLSPVLRTQFEPLLKEAKAIQTQ